MKFRSTICASLLALAASASVAAPMAVEPFDKGSWPAIVRGGAPAIVVFTSVGCTHCPGAIARLAAKRKATTSRVRLYIVSIDAEDDSALLADAHYAPADRLFSFRGSTSALQFSVNPEWRGMTPYMAYTGGKGDAKFVLGEPKDGVLADWLKAPKSSP